MYIKIPPQKKKKKAKFIKKIKYTSLFSSATIPPHSYAIFKKHSFKLFPFLAEIE